MVSVLFKLIVCADDDWMKGLHFYFQSVCCKIYELVNCKMVLCSGPWWFLLLVQVVLAVFNANGDGFTSEIRLVYCGSLNYTPSRCSLSGELYLKLNFYSWNAETMINNKISGAPRLFTSLIVFHVVVNSHAIQINSFAILCLIAHLFYKTQTSVTGSDTKTLKN